MTREQIDSILDSVRQWPPERQEEAAKILLMLEERDSAAEYELSEEELADLKEAVAEADRGEFATDEEVAEMFARLRR